MKQLAYICLTLSWIPSAIADEVLRDRFDGNPPRGRTLLGDARVIEKDGVLELGNTKPGSLGFVWCCSVPEARVRMPVLWRTAEP